MTEFESAKPITLRCGLTLPNRLVKASMSENISTAQSLPDDKIQNVYRQWARGGWGLIITGIISHNPTVLHY
jgi:2,4-dienoyl-CoA reductase-like NADH-dependent reductase (Old Yellow Enzyme family)